MVKVINYQLRKAEGGKEFYALILQGGIEIVKSQSGGQYATARQVSLPSTFTEASCKALVGQDLPGRIDKVDSEPYEYIVQGTGEVIMLTHKYIYIADEQSANSNQFITIPGFEEVYRPSKNGHLAHA